jgi:hypothetical protein
MLRYLMIVLLLGGFAAVNVGCRAEGEIDDDNGGVKVDVDDKD